MRSIFGRKPVLEAINSNKEIDRVIIAFGQQGDIINKIKIAAKRKRIKVSQVSLSKFKEFDNSKNTQGVIAILPLQKYFQLDEIIAISKQSEFPLLLLLDSIQDPHNLGAIIRTAECSGVNGIITTFRNSASVNETVLKTSAGAANYVKIARVDNLANTIDTLKDNGFWVVGSKLGDSQTYTSIDFKQPIALVMGNEEKGIRPIVAKRCDFLAEIPMVGKIQSLNVSVATGILLFEIMRQRQN